MTFLYFNKIKVTWKNENDSNMIMNKIIILYLSI